jgi:hypothetical protein
MRPLFIGGILLIAIGLAVLGIDNISFTDQKAVLDAGPIKVTEVRQHTIHIPSIAAVIAVVAGAAMVFFGRHGAKA